MSNLVQLLKSKRTKPLHYRDSDFKFKILKYLNKANPNSRVCARRPYWRTEAKD